MPASHFFRVLSSSYPHVVTNVGLRELVVRTISSWQGLVLRGRTTERARFARDVGAQGHLDLVVRTSADISRRRHRRKTRITVSCPRCGIGAHFLNPDHVEAPAAVPSRRGEQPNAGVVQRDGRAMVRSRDNAVVSDRWPYRRALAAIAALGLVAAVGSLCFFTVDSADYAIVTEFGKPTQVITAPGLGFKHPLAERPDVRPSPVRLRCAAERIPDP